MINMRGLFSPQAIVEYLVSLPVLLTPVMDSVFTARPQHPLPFLGVDELTIAAWPLPVVKRGSPSVTAVSESGTLTMFEPLPVRPNKFVSAADLNTLKMLKAMDLNLWAQAKTDFLRRAVRRTTEAICSLSLSGSFSWPIALDKGGWDTYTVNYGAIQSVTPENLWDASSATLKDVFTCCEDMQLALQMQGYGAEVVIWAGKAAFSQLVVLALAAKNLNTMDLRIEQNKVNVGGFVIERRAEPYRDPRDGTFKRALPDDRVRMIAMDAGHRLPYCAVDDLDANLLAMPFFVKPVKKEDPSGYDLIAESKPFPVVNPRGVCDAVVLSS